MVMYNVYQINFIELFIHKEHHFRYVMFLCVSVKSCASPIIIGATLDPADGPYNYTAWVKVKCDTGYVLSDNTTCFVTQCMDDKTWSVDESCTSNYHAFYDNMFAS